MRRIVEANLGRRLSRKEVSWKKSAIYFSSNISLSRQNSVVFNWHMGFLFHSFI